MEKLRRLLLLFKQHHISTKLPSLNLSPDEAKIAISEQNVSNLPIPGMLASELHLYASKCNMWRSKQNQLHFQKSTHKPNYYILLLDDDIDSFAWK